mgnify:CR=1 FL=1
MDNPIFKLEKVVQAKGSEPLEDFEGPLDLILYLLSKNKIEIQDIPIALILDQYQAYLEQRQRMDLEVAREFIAMAAHLVYIKTRMLLNLEDEEAQRVGSILHLSEAELMEITHFERGSALISTNNNNVAVEIKCSELEKELITTDRRELQELLKRNGKTS